MAGDEPSWMSRVKRVRTGEEIVVNRDEDVQVDMAEKGGKESERGDMGRFAMFGAPTGSSRTVTGSESSSDRKVGEQEKTERERENDEHPPKNVLADESAFIHGGTNARVDPPEMSEKSTEGEIGGDNDDTSEGRDVSSSPHHSLLNIHGEFFAHCIRDRS